MPRRITFRLPLLVVLGLLPPIFLGSCYFSISPVWHWLERSAIHPVGEDEESFFPVLVRSDDGKYLAARSNDIPKGSKFVLSVARGDEERINRDLRASVGATGNYRFFQVLGEEGGATQVVLEEPTTRDRMLKGWYSLKAGTLTPQKILTYGPGFAFEVIPWSLMVGATSVVVFLGLVVRFRREPAAGGEALK